MNGYINEAILIGPQFPNTFTAIHLYIYIKSYSRVCQYSFVLSEKFTCKPCPRIYQAQTFLVTKYQVPTGYPDGLLRLISLCFHRITTKSSQYVRADPTKHVGVCFQQVRGQHVEESQGTDQPRAGFRCQ